MKTRNFNPTEVMKGRKAWGYVNILNTLAVSLDMPVMVINGKKEGPVFTVTGGLYPTEYCGVEAAARIYQQINPEDLSGKIIIIPVVNMQIFQFRTPMMALRKSFTPMDGLDINRAFPGNLEGSLTEVLAYKLFNDYIIKSDYHVDLRGGELTESHLQHTIFLQIGKKIDKATEEMAIIFGLKYCLPSRPDIPHTSPRTLIYEAMLRGVNSIISESGIGYNTQPKEDEVIGHVNGVLNLLYHLKMIEGFPEKPKNQFYLIADRPLVNAPLPGIFKAFADQGDYVKKNQLIGLITDIDNDVLSEIISPCDAVVHEMIPGRIVFTGDQLYRLAKIGESTEYSVNTSTEYAH